MIVLLLNACSSDEPSKDQLFNTFHVKIGNGGIEATHKTSNIIGNSSCQNLYVGIPFMIGGHAYRFNIDLIDNGRITRIRFLDYDVDKDYANASFVTAQHFEISNLEYSLMDERLYFDFSGTLFEINNASESIDISGTIDFLYYPEASCSFNPWRMEAMVNDYNFQSVFGANSQDSFGNQWIFYCDNGYYIGLELEDVIEDMPLGTYTFTTEDTHNRIDIQKFIGDIYATAFNFPPHHPNEWQTFKTAGVFEITEKYVDENGTPVINGSFSLQAYDEDTLELVYEIVEGKFSL